MDFNGRYILDQNGNPQPCEDLITWAQWLEQSGEIRRVARDQIWDYLISTVFLGLDQSWVPWASADPLTYQPVLWESMVFKFKNGEILGMRRYASREDAIAGHITFVALVQKAVERGKEPFEEPDEQNDQDQHLDDAVPRGGQRQDADDPEDQTGDDNREQQREQQRDHKKSPTRLDGNEPWATSG